MMQLRPWPGRPISYPGVYTGLPINVYHSAFACDEISISASGLKTIFGQSPRHYWAFSVYNKNRFEREESKEMVLGQATHHLLLGEAKFKSRFAVRPDTMGGVRFSKASRACAIWLEDREREGRTVITLAQLEQIKGMAAVLRDEPLIRAGILNGLIETSFIWKDAETGIWLKARPDALPNESLDFSDLKTTSSIFEEDLRRSIYAYGYFQQAALLSEGCFRCTGQRMNSFNLVFVESKPPHCVSVRTLKEEDIERGHRANRAALHKFAECLASGKWPGPDGEQRDAAYIEMRPWDQTSIERKLEIGL